MMYTDTCTDTRTHVVCSSLGVCLGYAVLRENQSFEKQTTSITSNIFQINLGVKTPKDFPFVFLIKNQNEH